MGMTENSVLLPQAVKDQCDGACRKLGQDSINIKSVQKHLQDFIADDELSGEAYSALKMQVCEYIPLTSAMVTANELDLADIAVFREAVGKEKLEGGVILANREEARREKEEFAETASEYARKAAGTWLFSAERSWYQNLSSYYSIRAWFAGRREEKWREKEEKYNAIEEATKNLFTRSREFRDAVSKGLSSLPNAFRGGKYTTAVQGGGWREQLARANNSLVGEIKAGFYKEEGEYDWEKIGEWLEREPEEITESEYLAFIDMMSGMGDADLSRLFTEAQINSVPLHSAYCNISRVMEEAAERYLTIARLEAELTLFDEHSRYEYDEAEMTNRLGRACLVYFVVDSMHKCAGKRHYVDISTQTQGGKDTYTAEVSVNGTSNLEGMAAVGEATYAVNAGRVIRVNPWGTSATAERDMNDRERATFFLLRPDMGGTIGSAGADYIAGQVIEWVGKKTAEEAGAVLSNAAVVADLLFELKEDYEDMVIIDGALGIIDTREAVQALGIRTGVTSLSGKEENTVCLVCPKYDPEELYVRVAVYNSVCGENVTVEELKGDFSAGGGENLTAYMDWYYEGGDGDIEEYWKELEIIAVDLAVKNSEMKRISVKDMTIPQLEELIHKKNDPSYEMNLEIMEGK